MSTHEELDEKIGFYLENEDERNRITLAAKEYVHRMYDYRKVVDYMIEVIETGSSSIFDEAEIIG